MQSPLILGAGSIGCGPSLTLRKGRNAAQGALTFLQVCLCTCVCTCVCDQAEEILTLETLGLLRSPHQPHDFSSPAAPPPQHAAPLQTRPLRGEDRMPAARGKSRSKVSSDSSSFRKVPSCET